MNARIWIWRSGSIRLRDSAKSAVPPPGRCTKLSKREWAQASSATSSIYFSSIPIPSDYLGRLCSFATCPKGKRDCLVPGCGEIPFNKRVDGFVPHADLLAPARFATLHERGVGRLRSALDLPVP
jgi:hypothetical protein